jgi:hypothetical protein
MKILFKLTIIVILLFNAMNVLIQPKTAEAATCVTPSTGQNTNLSTFLNISNYKIHAQNRGIATSIVVYDKSGSPQTLSLNLEYYLKSLIVYGDFDSVGDLYNLTTWASRQMVNPDSPSPGGATGPFPSGNSIYWLPDPYDFIGYPSTANGKGYNTPPLPNPWYPDYDPKHAKQDFVKSYDWISNPWSDPEVLNAVANSQGGGGTVMPSPADSMNKTSNLRIGTVTNAVVCAKPDGLGNGLRRSLDRFDSWTLNPEKWDSGYFRDDQTYDVPGFSAPFIQDTSTPLTYFATVNMLPTAYEYGLFTMYYKVNGFIGFKTFFMKPYSDLRDCLPGDPPSVGCSKPDIVTTCPIVIVTTDPSYKTGSPISSYTFQVRVNNTPAALGGAAYAYPDIPVSFRWGTDLNYYSTTIKSLKQNEAWKTITLSPGGSSTSGAVLYHDVKNGNTTSPATGFSFPTVTGSSQAVNLIVNVNSANAKPIETDVTNNRATCSNMITNVVNAKLTNDGASKSLYKDTPLGINYTVENNMLENIDAPCIVATCQDPTRTKFTFQIFDKTANAYIKFKSNNLTTLTVPYSGIADQNKFVYQLDESLPAGNYRIEAKIPFYKNGTQNEGNYVDNNSDFDIVIASLPPENAICKEEKPAYYDNTGTMPNTIHRMCVGMYPNFPSTNAEGGQGTYFWAKYRLVPVPAPIYTINSIAVNDKEFSPYAGQTYDATKRRLGKGTTETYALKYPAFETAHTLYSGTNIFDANMTITKDYQNEKQSFIYFPSSPNHFLNKAPNAMVAPPSAADVSLVGGLNNTIWAPYTAGADKHYHYLYRGRFLAKAINFSFDVTGPQGESVAKGLVKYTVPADAVDPTKNCYQTAVIDYKDTCREVEFYLPRLTGDAISQAPADLDTTRKIKFYNPGPYAFTLVANEEQYFRYQHDGGDEYQGDAAHKTGISPTVAGPTSGPVKVPYRLNPAYPPTGLQNNVTYKPRIDFLNFCEDITDAFSGVTATSCIHDYRQVLNDWKYDWTKPLWYSNSQTALQQFAISASPTNEAN